MLDKIAMTIDVKDRKFLEYLALFFLFYYWWIHLVELKVLMSKTMVKQIFDTAAI